MIGRLSLVGMSKRTNPKKPAKSWRVIIMRSRGELLGYVEALDREGRGRGHQAICVGRRPAATAADGAALVGRDENPMHFAHRIDMMDAAGEIQRHVVTRAVCPPTKGPGDETCEIVQL
jgi:hypothetical protein